MTGETTDSSLDSRIRKWLEGQGYPLELETAQKFQEAAFRTFSSYAYLDDESGAKTWREIDLLASRDLDLDGQYLVRVYFCAECKTSDKPWLLFRHSQGRLAKPARIVQRYANNGGQRILRKLAHDRVWPIELFDIDQPHAHSITQAFTTGRDVAWEACLSASKAAHYEASLNGQGIAIVALPLIVIDGPLYYCELTSEGAINLEAVEQGDLVWSRPDSSPFVIVKVIRRSSLPRIAQDLRMYSDAFLKLVEREKNGVLALLEDSKDVGKRYSAKRK